MRWGVNCYRAEWREWSKPGQLCHNEQRQFRQFIEMSPLQCCVQAATKSEISFQPQLIPCHPFSELDCNPMGRGKCLLTAVNDHIL